MDPGFMLKVRICLKPMFYRGMSALLNTAPLLPPSARSLCSRHINPRPGGGLTDGRNGGRTDGQGGGQSSNSRRREEAFRDSAVKGRGPSSSKSVFAAGTAKRTAEMLQRRTAVVCQETGGSEGRTSRGPAKVQPPDRPLAAAEWRRLKESLGNPPRFDIQMICALFASAAELDIARSLLTFVAMETGTLSYELLLRYLTLCVSGGHDAEVFDVYDIMRGSFPCLDTGASSLFIKAFSRTPRWREAVGILQEVNKVFTPSQRNYGDVITAATLNGATATAWALYDELTGKGLRPHQDTWDALFTAARQGEEEEEAMSQGEQQERLLGILLYMRDNQIYPRHGLASSIKACFERLPGPTWTGSWTSATHKGVCRACGSELESIQLTADEYRQLKDRVMSDIIQGRDIFNKTTPEELERFKAFVERKPAFDVVVDGLNVANINKDKNRQSETLLAVVSELGGRGLEVLVLGRKHMLRPSRSWDRHNMSLVQQKAHCFFTENISEDDPFLLYAALHSGNHCRFVSRDLMRDHKACLPDGAARRLFFKWQRGHQLVVEGHVAAGRRVRFQSIPSYDTIVQTSADSWHVPYDDNEDRSTYEVPQRWLCLHTKP